jgi:hypothetical protein
MLPEEPMKQTEISQGTQRPAIINWAGYLALTLLVALPVAVLTVRAGAWQQGLLMYAISCLGSLLLLALFAVLWLLPRFTNWRGAILRRALFALPGAALLVMTLLSRGDHPAIHDISTDLVDPPAFSAADQQRGPDSNSLETDAATIALQAEAYPDLDTIVTTRAYDEVFDSAVRIGNEMGWEIYFQDRNAGIIEAVATTALMNFKDDVVIRLRTNADGTLVDLRSVSRVGIGDLGANANRIREFRNRLLQQ